MDDSISRQAAVEAVSEGCQEWRGIFDRCREKLLALPSVQPEREYTMEEFMFGQDMGNPEDGSL